MSSLDKLMLKDLGFENSLVSLLFKPKPKPKQEQKITTDKVQQEIKSADQQISDLEDEISNVADDLGLYASISITYSACCRGCGESFEANIDNVSQWDPAMSYCGKNQFCLP